MMSASHPAVLFPYATMLLGVEQVDEKLLNEDLEKMQPFLLKWFREYNVMMLNSPFKTLEYEVSMDGFAPVKDMLSQSHLYSIFEAFRELVKTHYYSQAAYTIEKELIEEGEIEWSNYWKYEVKNYYFRSIIPRIVSLLDYVAIMINELSQRELISNVRGVYFKTLTSSLTARKAKAGWLSYEEIKELDMILSHAYLQVTQEEKDILTLFRHTSTHRYFVGIDELTVPFQRRELSKHERKFLQSQYSYGFRGKPEYSFDELNGTVEKLLNNIDDMLSRLMEMDMMQNSVQRIENG